MGGYRGGMLHLASQSPQRAMLLRRAGLRFAVVPSAADEETVRDADPLRLALGRARVKAEGARLPPGASGAVLGADTVVALGGEEFGKPRDDADALRILRRLQGTTHQVITGHHLIRVADGAWAAGAASAAVTMRALSDEEIRAYLATGEHRGRAGAYALQETGDRFVTALAGSWDAVVGLDLATVSRLHRELLGGPPPTAP